MADNNGCILAELPGFGRVFDCGECGNIHLTVGPFGVTLAPDAYFQLVNLIHTSAANFEEWLLVRQRNDCSAMPDRALRSTSESNPDSTPKDGK